MHKAAFAAVALAVALASGCSSAPPVRFYVITPLATQAATAPAPGPRVVVAVVRLPDYLDRPQLVTRSGDNRLQLEEFHQWGGDLGKDLTRVMAENLSQLLGSDAVVAAPHTLRMRPDYRVAVEVLRFERGGDARVHLTAKWWLQRGAEAAPVASPTTALASEPLPEGAGFDATVAAMGGVYGELSRSIAQAIAAQEKATR
ncbi:MAG TPA: PqiC family protein [Burkholderiales bacterium]|nr:PqiC family protein [Burkholderiales bacterium]